MKEKLIDILNSDEVEILSEFEKKYAETAEELPAHLTVDVDRMGDMADE